jgi:hypothetical protein
MRAGSVPHLKLARARVASTVTFTASTPTSPSPPSPTAAATTTAAALTAATASSTAAAPTAATTVAAARAALEALSALNKLPALVGKLERKCLEQRRLLFVDLNGLRRLVVRSLRATRE